MILKKFINQNKTFGYNFYIEIQRHNDQNEKSF